MGNLYPLKYKIQDWFERIRQRIPIFRGKPPELTRQYLENPEYITPEQLENARAGYVVAINCAGFYVNAIWSIFNTMLGTNTAIFLTMGYVLITHQEYSIDVLAFLISIGIALCFIWFILVGQDIKFNEYYMNSARELEERYLFERVQTLSRGGEFAAGEKVYMTIDKKFTPFQLNRIQKIPAAFLAYSIIAIFSIIYLAIFIFIILRPIQVFLVRWG